MERAELLAQLAEPEQVDWDHYQDPGAYVPPPQAKDANGRFVRFLAQAPQTFEFGATKEGYLMVSFDLQITGTVKQDQQVSYTLRFCRASVKKFTNRKTGESLEQSMLGNFLRAVDKRLRPRSNSEYIQAVESVGGRALGVTIDWEAYDAESSTQVAQHYDDFPGENGQKEPYIVTEDGRKIAARAVVKQFFSLED